MRAEEPSRRYAGKPHVPFERRTEASARGARLLRPDSGEAGVMPVEGRGLSSRAAHDGGRDVGTGVSLSASERVAATPDGATCESEGSSGLPVLLAER